MKPGNRHGIDVVQATARFLHGANSCGDGNVAER